MNASNQQSFSGIDEAVACIARGGMVVVVDDEGRENEGDLVMAAQHATPEALAFMIRHTSGVVCVALSGERLDALQLPLMVARNEDHHGTAFTVTVDYRHGTTTGISAADRSATLKALADPGSLAEDFARPGHVFPLRAAPRGVLQRTGHTEAAHDLARLAGCAPVGVLCEIVNDDGTMARRDRLFEFARQHRLPIVTIDDLVLWRKQHEPIVEHVSKTRLPTRHGEFTAHVFRSLLDGVEHIALVRGEVYGRNDVLVRVHSECLTGDLLGSLRCDCGEQLDLALRRIAAEGAGVLVYLRGHEGRGIGLGHKIQAYALQDRGRDTVEANTELGLPVDARRYDVGAQILNRLGLCRIRVMSNNPVKLSELKRYALQVVERIPLETLPNGENRRYLATKRDKLGHLLGDA